MPLALAQRLVHQAVGTVYRSGTAHLTGRRICCIRPVFIRGNGLHASAQDGLAAHTSSLQVAVPGLPGLRNIVCLQQGMLRSGCVASGALACALLSWFWLDNRRIGDSPQAGHRRNSATSSSVYMAAALSDSNQITVGDLLVERIPCLSVRPFFAPKLANWSIHATSLHRPLQDNYAWLLQEKKSGQVAVVDPSEFKPVASKIQDRCDQ